ncbi:MAG: heme-degrading domain-containing protein [Sedimentibacter sp.]|uniref:heme-degrading domain-containing protein n=1 Tax=Sedimentibacter sp. TaxID=1960295 RepID=UPI003158483F
MNDLMKELLLEEENLQFDFFSNNDALNLGLTIIKLANEANQEIAVYIEVNRQPIFAYFLKGTYLEIAYWIKRKKNVVDRYAHSSMFVGEKFRNRGCDFNENSLLDPSEFQAAGGAFPILLKGVGMIGTVTVSGLSEEEDHKLCIDGIRSFLHK